MPITKIPSIDLSRFVFMSFPLRPFIYDPEIPLSRSWRLPLFGTGSLPIPKKNPVTNRLEVYDKCHHFGRAQRSIAAAHSASASRLVVMTKPNSASQREGGVASK